MRLCIDKHFYEPDGPDPDRWADPAFDPLYDIEAFKRAWKRFSDNRRFLEKNWALFFPAYPAELTYEEKKQYALNVKRKNEDQAALEKQLRQKRNRKALRGSW